MSAILLLIPVLLWAGLGVLLWRKLIAPRLRSTAQKWLIAVVAAAVWFVGPVLDEILGARTFERLCAEMPAVEFYGPVSVGPGKFFDEEGRPKWKSNGDFSLNYSSDWRKIFADKEEVTVLKKWPFPILQYKTVFFDQRTGKPVLVSYFIGAAGGWIKRVLDWGSMAPYQCPRKGVFPPDADWIKF
jgi:hypothetical protein